LGNDPLKTTSLCQVVSLFPTFEETPSKPTIALNKLKINLLGTGIEIKRVLLPEAVLAQWQGLLPPQKSMADALLDPFFYYRLKDKKYTSVEALPAARCWGMLQAPKNQIEFWFNRKKVYKLPTQELFQENLLFPLYNIRKCTTPFVASKGIYLHYQEIGTIGTCELTVAADQLRMDDFQFELDYFENLPFISGITYQQQPLEFVKKETMITYQSGLELG